MHKTTNAQKQQVLVDWNSQLPIKLRFERVSMDEKH